MITLQKFRVVIPDAIYVGELDNKHPTRGYSKYRYYVTGFNMDGTDYTVRYAVGLDANGKWIYDDQLMQIEKGELLAREANSGSKNALSTKDDIAFVNKLQEILINDATFDKNNYYKAKDAEYEVDDPPKIAGRYT